MTTTAAIVLAAGKGTRMRSHLPKVLHTFLGRPMLFPPVDAALRAGVDRVVVVVGHGASDVREQLTAAFPGWPIAYASQSEQRGTGHAVQCGLGAAGEVDEILVLYGDTPLLTSKTLAALLDAHRKSGAAYTVSTFRADDPKGYGRIVRDPNGNVRRIVEEVDASPEERAITEVNAGLAVASREVLAKTIGDLVPHNAQGELYLTDVVGALAARGKKVAAFLLPESIEAAGINTRSQLAGLEEVALGRVRNLWMDRGVSMRGAPTIWIDGEVEIGEDTTLGPRVQLLGKTRIGRGCRIDAGVILDHCEIGDGVHVKPYTVAAYSRMASQCVVGPFAHLRPGTVLGESVKIGNFVETKQASFGAHSKASHLSYLGDCEIGRDVNIGAGTITCNYDGFDKHVTTLEDGVFVGSDVQFVAPVTVHKNAVIAAGTTVVADVPEGALASARTPQTNREGYYERRRKPREEAKRAGKLTPAAPVASPPRDAAPVSRRAPRPPMATVATVAPAAVAPVEAATPAPTPDPKT